MFSGMTVLACSIHHIIYFNKPFNIIYNCFLFCHIREHALVKISIEDQDKKEIDEIVSNGNCKILDSDKNAMILELSGNESTVEDTIKTLERYNILELLRSGKMAMISGNKDKHKPKLIKSSPYWES